MHTIIKRVDLVRVICAHVEQVAKLEEPANKALLADLLLREGRSYFSNYPPITIEVIHDPSVKDVDIESCMTLEIYAPIAVHKVLNDGPMTDFRREPMRLDSHPA